MAVCNVEYDIKSMNLIDEQGNLVCGYYISLDYHRNNNPQKSQWIISIDEEISCFAQSKQNQWYVDDKAWGIKIGSDGIRVDVGFTTDNVMVWIARFQRYAEDKWHGYPAQINRKQSDIPDDAVLIQWRNKKYITNSEFSKIRCGKL